MSKKSDINEETAQERVEALVRLYKGLFTEEMNPENIGAINTNIKMLVLKDDHPQATPFVSGQYSKNLLGKALVAAEIQAFKDFISENNIDKVKQIIRIFQEFNEPRLDKLELFVLYSAIADKSIKNLSIIPPLTDMTKELFETVVQSNPDIEKFLDLYNDTLELIGQASQGT